MIRSLALAAGFALLWIILVSFRPELITARCLGEGAALCDPAQIPIWDAWAWGHQMGWADQASFMTQYAAGVLAFLMVLMAAKSERGPLFCYFLLCTLANGALTELIRVMIQRPRPFVFGALEHAESLAHYTSFVSGHTSYTAAMAMALTLKKSPRWVVVLGWLLCVATATFRVLAGRHFVSDTVGGMLSGSLAAYVCFRWMAAQARVSTKPMPSAIP